MPATEKARRINPIRPPLDAGGIGLSAVCAAHCVVTPFVLTALPAAAWLAGPFFHRLLGMATIVVACSVLIPGVHRHRRWSVLLFGGIGCVVLAVVSVLGVRWFSDSASANLHRVLLMVFGSACLIVAHFDNLLGHRNCDARQLQKEMRNSV